MSGSLNWFITGVSSGLGYALAGHALKQGHRVIGTVRDKKRSARQVSDVETAGGTCLTLDVTHMDAIPQAISAAEEAFGHIDVLVNNAGYCLLGPVEDITLVHILEHAE